MKTDEKHPTSKGEKILNSTKPIETDYEAHHADPGPPVEAIAEEDEDGAGKAMKWIIPLLVVALFVIWLIMR